VWLKGHPSLYWEIEAPSEEDVRRFIHIPSITAAERERLIIKKEPEPKPEKFW
jgi:hypothetical protein